MIWILKAFVFQEEKDRVREEFESARKEITSLQKTIASLERELFLSKQEAMQFATKVSKKWY